MLTDALLALNETWAHRILRWLGIELATFHDWMPGMCPCGAESLTITATLEVLTA